MLAEKLFQAGLQRFKPLLVWFFAFGIVLQMFCVHEFRVAECERLVHKGQIAVALRRQAAQIANVGGEGFPAPYRPLK